jgi:hypothetical protein
MYPSALLLPIVDLDFISEKENSTKLLNSHIQQSMEKQTIRSIDAFQKYLFENDL